MTYLKNTLFFLKAVPVFVIIENIILQDIFTDSFKNPCNFVTISPQHQPAPERKDRLMPMDSAIIEHMISSSLPECTVKIVDLAGDGDHYAVHVSSPAFAGKTRIQQHQMVYAALGDKLRGELHALSVQTSVPTA